MGFNHELRVALWGGRAAVEHTVDGGDSRGEMKQSERIETTKKNPLCVKKVVNEFII